VGLAAYSSFYQPIGGRPQVSGFPVPLQLTAGYQLRPRLAVQAGVAYSGSTRSYDFEYYSIADPAGPPRYHHHTGTSTIRNTSVSLLARYTLTRNPAHRVQFDALGGATLEHFSGYSRGTDTQGFVGSLESNDFSNRYSHSILLLTAGAGVRYRLTPRFDLNLDYTLNHPLLTASSHFWPSALTGTAALGVRYRFGSR
jgi:opacity protein-like surface antigen